MEYKELYDCSEFFMNFNLTESMVVRTDNPINRRARAFLIGIWVIRAVVFILSQEYSAYIKVFYSLFYS
jgi:hypothetical protein